MVKNLPVMQKIQVQSLGLEHPLEKGMATHPRWLPEYWSGLPCPPPRYLPNPGLEPRSPALQADSLTSEPPRKHIEVLISSVPHK